MIELMKNSVEKNIKVIYKNGKNYKGFCTEFVPKQLEEEEPMLFCEPNLAILKSEIKSIEIIEDTK